jgi:PAS domain S-box-containing protein
MDSITERQQAQAARAYLAAIVESSEDAIISKTLDGIITSWNKSAERIFRYRADEIVGSSISILIPPGRVDEELQILDRIKRGEKVEHYETVRMSKEGRLLNVSLSVSPIRDDSGKIIGTSKILRDLTERKQANEALKSLTESVGQQVQARTVELTQRVAEGEQLNRGMANLMEDVNAASNLTDLTARNLATVNEELEAFSYSVSHDLRAPLRHIDGFADLLQRHARPMLDEKGCRYLQTISESAKQMGVLIDDLLAFSHVGRAELRMATVDLNQTVKGALADVRHDIQGRHITWTIGALPTVYGDPAMLRQVLVNLIGNAVKYTRTCEETRIEIGYTDEFPGETVIFVRDNGVGFDMQYVDKLFGVFQRLHSVQEFDGTGIGLANVRRIIQRHGGRTWAEGIVGEGATFYFSFAGRKDTA